MYIITEVCFADWATISWHAGQNQVITEELAILTPQNIELLCNLTDIPNNPPNITGYWAKDGQEIENSEETVNRINEQYVLKKT